MKSRSIVAILATLAFTAAHADYDPKLEAREKAQRDAEKAAQARRDADAARQKSAAEQKMMRGTLGKEAEGKSDADVKKLYDKRMADYQDQARKAQANPTGNLPAGEQAKADAAMKSMTGKSPQDIMKMSPAEQEAFAKQMEKQYGGAK